MSMCQHLGMLVRKQAPNCPKRDQYRCNLLGTNTVPMECFENCDKFIPTEKPIRSALILGDFEVRAEYFDFISRNDNWARGFDQITKHPGYCLVVGGIVDTRLYDWNVVESLFIQYPTVGGKIIRERLHWIYETPVFWVDLFRCRPNIFYNYAEPKRWAGLHWADGGDVSA